MKNILLVAAENSAETYAVQVLKEFQARGDRIHFWGIGGDRLAAIGFENLVHNRALSVVGIVEVAAHLFRIRRVLNLVCAPGPGTQGGRRPADRLPRFQPAAGPPPAPGRHPGLLLHQSHGLGLAIRPCRADPPLGEPAFRHLPL